MMLSNTPEGSHKHAYTHTQHTQKLKEHLPTQTFLICISACCLAPPTTTKSIFSPLGGERSGGFFCTKSISVLAVTLRVLHSCPPLSLFVTCNSVMVPCGLLGTSGAEELMHKDAVSLKRHKQVFSVVTLLH